MTFPSPSRLKLVARTTWIPALLLTLAGLLPADATQRPGAVRTIQIRWGEPFPGSLFSPDIGRLSITRAVFGVAQPPDALQSTGPEAWRLFFTVEANGTRNIWQAVPEIDATKAPATPDSTGVVPNLRHVTWRATPLTRFTTPYFADEAAPTPDGRSILFTTNVDLLKVDIRNANLGFAGNAGTATGKQTPAITIEGRQIARLELATGRMFAMTTSIGRQTSPCVSPDGRRYAFVSDRSGMESVYIRSIEGATARRVATLARNPAWLDNGTLLFESTRPGQLGLYRLSVPTNLSNDNVWARMPRPRMLFSRPGETAVAPDGLLLCVAAPMNQNGAGSGPGGSEPGGGQQLFMLATDGSGANAIVGSAGAHNPSFAPDGQLLVFDAPNPQDQPSEATRAPANSPQAEARTVWLLPMLRVAPAAQLLEVRPAMRGGQAIDGELEVMGTAFAEGVGPLEARLEYSQASDSPRWRPLNVNVLPIHDGVLATWKPSAPGDWMLRLTVTDAAGDSSQSTLALTWPLPPPVVQAPPPPVFARPMPEGLSPATPPAETPAVPAPRPAPVPRPLPVLPLPALPPAPGQSASPGQTARPGQSTVPGQGAPQAAPTTKTPAPKVTPTPKRPPRPATGKQVPILPLPALPPAPGSIPPGTMAPTAPPAAMPTPAPEVRVPTPSPSPDPTTPVFPSPSVSPAAPTVASSSTPAAQPPIPDPQPRTPTPRYQAPTAQRAPARHPTPPAQRAPARHPTPAPPSKADKGSIRVSGTPAVLGVGEKVPVEVVLTNQGSNGWGTQSTPPVRLIYHWVNIDSGTRVRWYIQWLTAPVAPGGSLKLSFSLNAPPRAGRYRLTYALVRLQGETYEAPAYNARLARWPGEFGAASYNITVR